MATARSANRLTGPSTSTLTGDVDTLTMTYPGAGVPSMTGSTDTNRRPERSSVSGMVDGETCAISTPKGARTSAGDR